MSDRSRSLCSAVGVVLLLLGASVVAASPAASPTGREEGIFEHIEHAVGGWLDRLACGVLLGVRGASATSPGDPPAELTPTSSTEPVDAIDSGPATEGGPHWDPNG